jgi:WD40 repeat protein
MAVPFEPERLEVTGQATPILEGVQMTVEGAAHFDFSGLGSLIYVPGPVGEAQRRLVWLDREGVEELLAAPERNYMHARLSPDGRQIASSIEGNKNDVWVYDIPSQTLTPLTFEDNNQFPIWTPDGKRITYRVTRGGVRNLWWKNADGSGSEEQLTSGDHNQTAESWSPDGRFLAYYDSDPVTGGDQWILSVEGEQKEEPFLQTKFQEQGLQFSPNGRWVAYYSDESGREEVYVQPFPGPGRKWPISTAGGDSPAWTKNGRELFFTNGNKMMVVDIQTQPTFSAGKPRLLFELSPFLQSGLSGKFDFDITPDGQRFLMVKLSDQELPATQLTVVLNWFSELKRLVPTDN